MPHGNETKKTQATAIKEQEGNPGKRLLNENEPKSARKAPACPKWLDPDAKKEWRCLAKQMVQLGILTELDMTVFAAYCESWARYKEAVETDRGKR